VAIVVQRRRKATMIATTSAASTPSRSVTSSASSIGASLVAGGAVTAAAEDVQPVAVGLEAVRAADLGAQRDDRRADELDHPAAALAHQVIVLLTGVDVLVERSAEPSRWRRTSRIRPAARGCVNRGARHRHRRRSSAACNVEASRCTCCSKISAQIARRSAVAQASAAHEVGEGFYFPLAWRSHDLVETSSQEQGDSGLARSGLSSA
jgi:hypothetical protein